ncbi:PAS domain S-box protein [Actimicrobium antarcticum]|uniref:Diguanylate cyclase n=1 Tax=Actimicrobium antarcticum TaxID=1051899 RepID=A0ABP7SUZ0_9BURK
MSDHYFGSDTLFSTLAESIGLIAMVWELEPDIIHLSEQWTALTGHPSADPISSAQLRKIIHSDDLMVMNDAILRCLKGSDHFYDAEVRVLHRNGEWIWLAARGRVVERNAEHRAARIVASFLDIGHRKRAELILSESEQRYRAMFNISPHGILLTKPDGEILSANPAACLLTGYSEAELIHLGHAGLSKSADTARSSLPLTGLQMGSRNGQASLFRKDGVRLDVALSSATFTDQSGAMRISVMLQDITDSIATERKLQRLARLYDARSRCNQAIIQSKTPQALYEAVCKIVAECGDFGLAWVALVDWQTRQIKPSCSEGRERAYLHSAKISIDPTIPAGCGPLGRAIRESRNIICEDFQNAPSTAPWHALAGIHHFRAIAVFPLQQTGQTIGALTLYASDKDYFDAQLVELLAEIARDISFGLDNLQRDIALSSSEARFRTLWETSTDGILMMTQESIIRYANPALETLYGHPGDQLLGKSIAMLQPARFRTSHDEGIRRFLRSGRRMLNWRGASVVALHADGHEFPMEISFSEAVIDGERLFIDFMRDITERKRANDLVSHQNAILKMITSSVELPITLAAVNQMIEGQVSDTTCCIQGLHESDGSFSWQVAENLPESFTHFMLQLPTGKAGLPDTALDAARVVADLECDPDYAAHALLAREYGIRGTSFWPVQGRQGQSLAVLVLYHHGSRAISEFEQCLLPSVVDLIGLAIENRKSDERIRYLAHHDDLTGLPNRARFMQELTLATARAARGGHQVGLLFLDLDRFKNINDTLGHHTGDAVLREVANRLRHAVREVDMVARLGGDEFVVMAENFFDLATLTGIAQKLIEQISQPMDIEAQEFHLTVSIGISIYPVDGSDIHTLIKNADMAMYRVKELGRNSHQFYDEQMSAG